MYTYVRRHNVRTDAPVLFTVQKNMACTFNESDSVDSLPCNFVTNFSMPVEWKWSRQVPALNDDALPQRDHTHLYTGQYWSLQLPVKLGFKLSH